MKVTDLNEEDQALVNKDFPAELEKWAAEEASKATELYTTGFDKLASEAANELDKLAEEDKEKEEEDEEESEAAKKLDEGEKKEAAARGAFIARGYIDGLMKEGQERHEDPYHYLYPALSEKTGMDASKLKGALHSAGKRLSEAAAKAKAGVKSYHKGMAEHAGKAMNKALPKKERAMEAGKAALKASPHLALLGLGGYGAHRAMKKKD